MQAASSIHRIGVMGGTFDPIHVGHLIAASEALHVFSLDRIVFVPTGQPWQKTRYSNSEDRFMMTALGASPHPCFSVSRVEIDRKGPTYTADTMRELRTFYGETCELYFIAGADAVARVGTWRKLHELAEQAELIAVTRPGYEMPVADAQPGWPRIHVMEMPLVGVSATDIRARVRAGKPIDYLVPHDVATYIKERGLYVGDAAA